MKVLEKNGQVIEGNFEEKEVKEAFWHTSAHVLAQAVKRLYPDTKCAIGPAIDYRGKSCSNRKRNEEDCKAVSAIRSI